METWREIKWADGYEISSFGRVRSRDRSVITKTGIRSYRGKILAPFENKSGHQKVWVRTQHGRAWAYIHRIVADHFIGPCPQGHEVAHNDGNPRNNRYDNLRYATAKDNNADKRQHGTLLQGDDHPSSILTSQQIDCIRERIAAGDKQRDIAASFGVSRTTISAISTGRSWAHIGRAA